MAVTTKLNVDIGGFKTGMQEAQNSVKTLDAALKKNEAQFKATGNAEEYMSNKANLLWRARRRSCCRRTSSPPWEAGYRKATHT